MGGAAREGHMSVQQNMACVSGKHGPYCAKNHRVCAVGKLFPKAMTLLSPTAQGLYLEQEGGFVAIGGWVSCVAGF